MRVNRPETNSEPRARPRFGIGAAIVLVIVVLVIAVLISALAPRGSTQLLPAGAVPSSSASLGITAGSGRTGGALGNDSVGPLFLVHVLGQVQRPGLYELHQGDKVLITKYKRHALLVVQSPRRDYFELLRTKLQLGARGE